MVRHPERGEGPEGRALASEIVQLVEGSEDRVVIVHDATRMQSASVDYAVAFSGIEPRIAPRTDHVVCAIPKAVLRVMARTVAMAGRKSWLIMASAEEAAKWLADNGYELDGWP